MRKRGIRLKTADDIDRIRDAGRINAEIFQRLSEMSLTGISTWDIDLFIESIILKEKGRPAFKTIAGYNSSSCISVNSEVVHGVPAKKKVVCEGDIVKVDIGVVLKGYFSDACFTFSAGKISKETGRLVETAREALNRAIGVMVPGNRIGDIGHVIQEYAEKSGFSVIRNYSGHGVGFALHEPPSVPHYGRKGGGMLLQAGMVLAVEPIIHDGSGKIILMGDGWTAVTSDGKLSAQFEHTIAITDSGPLILTE